MLNVEELVNFDFKQIISYLQEKGATCEKIPESDIVVVRYKDHVEYLVDYELPYIPLGYKNILQDKFFFKRLLMDIDIPVHPGEYFLCHEVEKAVAYAQTEVDWPIVVKPTAMDCGDLVFCAIDNERELREIWHQFIENSPYGPFFIEPCWSYCPDYRFIIIPGQVPHVVKRSPPTITGDGMNSIKTLILNENKKRSGKNRNSLCQMDLNDIEIKRCLKVQKRTLEDVLNNEETIFLRFSTNLSCGGMSEMISAETVHETYWPIFQKVWDLFPALPILNLDILTYDITKPATKENMVVSEAHITPGVGMFIAPGRGEGVNLYPDLARMIFPELG